MIKITKKKKIIHKAITLTKEYNLEDAVNILKKYQSKKFIESVDIAINLNINPKKTEQNIRGTTVLPHGIGKEIKIAVFTHGDNIIKAKENGADLVGGSEILETIKNKKNNFDIIIASPESMKIVSTLGPILGPRGLMPNPKTGTVTNDIVKTVKNFKKGQIQYKNDKNGIIHTTIGKVNFSNIHLRENFLAFIHELNKLKPKTSKGLLIKKIVLSTTMGIGLTISNNF